MRANILFILPLVFLLSLPGVLAAGGKAVIVSDVEGLGKYTEVEEPVYQPGEKVKLYVEVNDVDHAGFVAVNFYVIVYNTRLEIKDVIPYNVRYRHHVRDVFITPEFKIPETWEEGTYFIKVRAYDVADEEKVRRMYARGLEWFNPDYGAAKSFTEQPEGVNVGGYSGYLKSETFAQSILTQTLRFKLVKRIPAVGVGVKPTREIVSYPVNISYLIDSQVMEKPTFISQRPFTFNFSMSRGIHNGVVALDYFFLITNDKNEPIYYSRSTVRYIKYPADIISNTFTHQLSEGKYFLIVKIYDRANPEPLRQFLRTLSGYSEVYDTKKIDAYRIIKEGRNVGDVPYSTLGLLKPASEENLVYFGRIPFEILSELKEEKLTAPVLKFISLEPSDFVLNLSQPFSVKVKFKNIGREGTVDIIMDIKGEKRGYRLRQSLFAEPNVEKTVVFNVTLPLTEGAWKISIFNSTLSEVILVQRQEVIEQLERNITAEEEELFAPVEMEKPKTPLLIIGFLILALVALMLALKRRYGGRIPQEFALPIKISLAIQFILIILYVLYLYR
ncbi:hypothetical protein [Candidatus Pyrohabitans sp.]